MKAKNNNFIIWLTLLVSLLLTIMPLPILLDSFRPNWTLLVLSYWCLALPNRVNVLTAWLIGLVVDILLGSVLGINAFACAIVIYVTANHFQKIRNFSIWQQSLIVCLLTSFYHLIVFWLQRFVFDVDFSFSYMKPVITTSLMWWIVFLLLRKTRRHFRVQ